MSLTLKEWVKAFPPEEVSGSLENHPLWSRPLRSISHRPERWSHDVPRVDFHGLGLASPSGLTFGHLDCPGGDQVVLRYPNLSEVVRQGCHRLHRALVDGITWLGVTGTNGKSTVVHLLRELCQIVAPAKIPCSLGTLGLQSQGWELPSPNTTPFPLDLYPLAKEAHEKGSRLIAMEASSHGLAEGRLYGIDLAAAGWTNLGHDHLDFHGDRDSYREAKARIFEHCRGFTSINSDEPELSRYHSRSDVTTFSQDSSKGGTRGILREQNETGSLVEFHLGPHRMTQRLPLLGRHNLSNTLCALDMLSHLDFDPHALLEALPSLTAPLGRMSPVETRAKGRVFIDYAHTPDALEQACLSAREHFPQQRLVVLFGCGGDRDKSKRPLMANVTERYAGSVWVTSDNPRTEDPLEIIADIQRGFTNISPFTEEDREKAIHLALDQLSEDDVLLICGKGHEKEQIIGTTRRPLNEFECCQNH